MLSSVSCERRVKHVIQLNMKRAVTVFLLLLDVFSCFAQINRIEDSDFAKIGFTVYVNNLKICQDSSFVTHLHGNYYGVETPFISVSFRFPSRHWSGVQKSDIYINTNVKNKTVRITEYVYYSSKIYFIATLKWGKYSNNSPFIEIILHKH